MAVPADAVTAVWPTAAAGARSPGPVAAARGFAVAPVGFADDVVVGGYRAGDSRSGEVDVRPDLSGPVTTVLVRQFSDGNWWVLGASTADVVLDRPGAGETLASPAELTGTDVRLRRAGDAEGGRSFLTRCEGGRGHALPIAAPGHDVRHLGPRHGERLEAWTS